MRKMKQIVISIITITLLFGIQNTSVYGYNTSSSVLSNVESRAVTSYDISKTNVNINKNGDYLITGQNNQSNFNHITVSGNITANITIRDLWIYLKDSGNQNEFLFGAIDLQKGATVNLTLEGTNYLKGSRYGAGIQVPKGTTLRITKESTGSLEAHGGDSASGIGAAGNQKIEADAAIRDLGTIIIDGGTIKAYGNAVNVICPAGIGGSDRGTTGKIIINGGNIMATHEKGDPNAYNLHAGSGIGGGYIGSVEEIQINGGTINATGASGIGNGFWDSVDDPIVSCGKITITGGDITVNAKSNTNKASSIGSGGTRGYGTKEITGDIKITGGQFNLNKGVYPQPKDGNNNDVYPLTLQVKGEQIKKDEIMSADLSLIGDNYSQTVSGLNFKSNEDTISTSWQVYLASRDVKATLKSDNGIYQKAFNMPNQATTVLLDAGLYGADLYFNDYRINETSNFKSFSVKQNGTTLTSDNLIYNDHLEILDGGRAKFKMYAPANSGSTTINAIINNTPGV